MSPREAALLALPALPAAKVLVVTTDTLVAGVHFLADTPPEDLACKALAVNLSDLAAMGAQALAAQVQVHGPRSSRDWRQALCQQLTDRALALDLDHCIARADSHAQGLSVLALGSVPRGQALTRDGARPGDDLWVSGCLGDAGAGLELATSGASGLDAASEKSLRQRLDRPEPRLALGQALVGIAHSAIDVSDGLVGDSGHILKRSRVAAELWLQALPLSPALVAFAGIERARQFALCAGDDYELCFSAASSHRQSVQHAGALSRTPVHRVGRIFSGEGLRLLDAEGRTLALPRAYQHFQDPAPVKPRLGNPVHLLALGLGSGLSPRAPGTAGTVVGVATYLLLENFALPVYVCIWVVLAVAGVWICGRTARDMQVHDHPAIVFDEVVGYLVAMTAAPTGWFWVLAGFALFRLFDIWKPWPIGLIDKHVAGGAGIMADDLLAGLFALAVLQATAHWLI